MLLNMTKSKHSYFAVLVCAFLLMAGLISAAIVVVRPILKAGECRRRRSGGVMFFGLEERLDFV